MAEPYDISSPDEEERKRARQDRMVNPRPVLDQLIRDRTKPKEKGRRKKRRLSATERRDRDARKRQKRQDVRESFEQEMGRQPSQHEVNRSRSRFAPTRSPWR